MSRIVSRIGMFSVSLVAMLAVGCASSEPLPTPAMLKAPTPIAAQPATGKYVSPYTSDGVLAKWVDTSMKAKATGDVAGAGASIGASMALKTVPFAGGILGDIAGKEIGKGVAFAAAGGEPAIRAQSDQSFDNLDDLIVYLYVNYSSNPHYKEAMEATASLYPEINDRSEVALRNAAKNSPGSPVASAN